MARATVTFGRAVTTSDGLAVEFVAQGDNKAALAQIVNKMKLREVGAKEPVKYTIEIKKYRKQRSLDANGYFHLLVSRLAKHHNQGEDEMKVRMVLEYGAIDSDDEGLKIGFKLLKSIDASRVSKYAKWVNESVENGKLFSHYIIYKHTSEMDTSEMYRLLQGVRYECEKEKIPYKTPAEKAEEDFNKWYEKQAK